jgi:hypothetical protein
MGVRLPNGVSGLETAATTGDIENWPVGSGALLGDAALSGLQLLSQLSFAGLEADSLTLLT